MFLTWIFAVVYEILGEIKDSKLYEREYEISKIILGHVHVISIKEKYYILVSTPNQIEILGLRVKLYCKTRLFFELKTIDQKIETVNKFITKQKFYWTMKHIIHSK